MYSLLQFFILLSDLFVDYLFLCLCSLLSLVDDPMHLTFGFVPGLDYIFFGILFLGDEFA